MSQTETRKWTLRAYHETPENAALRGQPAPPPAPVTIAREELARRVADDGWLVDLTTVREVSREAVVVENPEEGFRAPLPDERLTGHVILWEVTGHPREQAEPRIGTEMVDGESVARIPAAMIEAGGSVRVVHQPGALLTGRTLGGEEIPLPVAMEMSPTETAVEFLGGTAYFVVSAP